MKKIFIFLFVGLLSVPAMAHHPKRSLQTSRYKRVVHTIKHHRHRHCCPQHPIIIVVQIKRKPEPKKTPQPVFVRQGHKTVIIDNRPIREIPGREMNRHKPKFKPKVRKKKKSK